MAAEKSTKKLSSTPPSWPSPTASSGGSSLNPLLFCSFGSSLPEEISKEVYSKVFYQRSNHVYGCTSQSPFSGNRGQNASKVMAFSRGGGDGSTEKEEDEEEGGQKKLQTQRDDEAPTHEDVFSGLTSLSTDSQLRPEGSRHHHRKHNLNSRFSEHLSRAGMYRSQTLTTALDKDRFVTGAQDWRLRNL